METIQNIASKLSIEDITENERILVKCPSKISKSDQKSLKKIILKGENEQTVYGSLILYVYYLSDEGVHELRKEGFFGYWKNDRDKIQVKKATSILLNHEKIIQLSQETKNYLQKKQNNAWLGQYFCMTQLEIDQMIKSHHDDRKQEFYNSQIIETSLLRELISYIDFLFLIRDKNATEEDIDLDDFASYPNEEVASAVSFLIYRYNNLIGIKNVNSNSFMDADYVLSDELESLILITCKFLRLREWEFYWDRYGYDILEDGCFYSPNPTLEKSIKLGYINTQVQEVLFFNNISAQLVNENYPSLFEYKKMLETHEDMTSYLTIKTGTGFFERYALKNILEVFQHIGGSNAEKYYLYLEEIAVLRYMEKELVTPAQKLLERKFEEYATMKDAILFPRLFFLNRMHYQYILNHGGDTKAIIRSMGQMIHYSDMEALINTQIHDMKKTRNLLNFYTYQGGIYDIQYTPLLKIGDHYCCPTNICAVSNFIRNSIAYSYQMGKKSLFLENTGEDLEKLCADAFKQYPKLFQVEQGKKYQYKGHKGEIDLFVISDDILLFIECKNPFLPTNAFSMRTSFDYIEKATKQLDHEMQAFSDEEFQKNYLESIHIPYKKRILCSCIIMGNRLFSGYTGAGHSIRYIHDLLAFLKFGKINLLCQNRVIVKSIWKNEQFTVQDLKAYLSDNDSPSKKFQMGAMMPYTQKMSCGTHIVGFKTYKIAITEVKEEV